LQIQVSDSQHQSCVAFIGDDYKQPQKQLSDTSPWQCVVGSALPWDICPMQCCSYQVQVCWLLMQYAAEAVAHAAKAQEVGLQLCCKEMCD
jgi:hypothetical protein